MYSEWRSSFSFSWSNPSVKNGFILFPWKIKIHIFFLFFLFVNVNFTCDLSFENHKPWFYISHGKAFRFREGERGMLFVVCSCCAGIRSFLTLFLFSRIFLHICVHFSILSLWDFFFFADRGFVTVEKGRGICSYFFPFDFEWKKLVGWKRFILYFSSCEEFFGVFIERVFNRKNLFYRIWKNRELKPIVAHWECTALKRSPA